MRRMTYILLFILLLCPTCHASIKNRVEIDLDSNLLLVYHGERLLGSYTIASGMREEMTINGKKYCFKTPTGNFKVWQKKIDPLWVPPDWYFVSRNVPVVKDREPQKWVLGSRALYLSANGLMIHGTQDETTIGKYVTHGCIRMFQKDLEEVYELINVGAEVFIY